MVAVGATDSALMTEMMAHVIAGYGRAEMMQGQACLIRTLERYPFEACVVGVAQVVVAAAVTKASVVDAVVAVPQWAVFAVLETSGLSEVKNLTVLFEREEQNDEVMVRIMVAATVMDAEQQLNLVDVKLTLAVVAAAATIAPSVQRLVAAAIAKT